MTLIQLLGDVGSGKTLFTTYLAKYEERPVFSNYWIDIEGYHPLKPEMLAKMHKPALILVDEAYRWIEARTSGRQINRYMSYILFQSRKKGIDFALTDQLEETIDIRFRMMTNYEIHCQQLAGVGFEYLIFKNSAFRHYNPVKLIMPYESAEKLFPLFNSWEEQPIDQEMLLNVTEDKTEIIADIDKIVDYLLTKADSVEYRKGDVADFCLRKGYPKTYVPMVYDALKARRFSEKVEHEPEVLNKKPYRLRD